MQIYIGNFEYQNSFQGIFKKNISRLKFPIFLSYFVNFKPQTLNQ